MHIGMTLILLESLTFISAITSPWRDSIHLCWNAVISGAHFVPKIQVCAVHTVLPSSLPRMYKCSPTCLGQRLSSKIKDSWCIVTWVTIRTNQNYILIVRNTRALPCSSNGIAQLLLLQVRPCKALKQLPRMIDFIDSLWTDKRAKSGKSLVMDSSVYKWKKKKKRKLFLLDFRTAKSILNVVGFFFLSKELKKKFLISDSVYCCLILQTSKQTNSER